MRVAVPERRHLKADLLAGLPVAIGGVPDGMAAGVLAGVNPVHGLYASFAGPIGGGLTSSTRLMVITTTGAGALAAGSAVSGVAPAQRSEALVLLTLIAGVLMIAAGVAKLGRYTRFVSHSVMLGFLTGVALNIIFGQLSDLTGAPAEGGFALAKAVDVIVHPRDIDVPSLLVGLGAMAILVLLARTRLGIVGALVALVVPDGRRPRGRTRHRGPGRRHRRDPPRHPVPDVPRPRPALAQPDHRRGVRGGDRPRPGRRRRRVGPEPRRAVQLEPGLHGPGRRQPGVERLRRPARRWLGRADRAQRDRRRAHPLGAGSCRASG